MHCCRTGISISISTSFKACCSFHKKPNHSIKHTNKNTECINTVHKYQVFVLVLVCVISTMCKCVSMCLSARLVLIGVCCHCASIVSTASPSSPPTSPVSSQAHLSVCRKTRHSGRLAWSQ